MKNIFLSICVFLGLSLNISAETILDRIETNFGDGTWGTKIENGSTNLPAAGQYPTAPYNGFNLINAVLYGNTPVNEDGVKYTYTIAMEKGKGVGIIEFPQTKTVGAIEIHAMSGSDNMGYFLQEYTNGKWENVGEQVITKKSIITIYSKNIERTETSRFRIYNAVNSGLFVAKIIVRSLQEVNDLNIVSHIPNEGDICYYNLTKEVVVTFNKNISAGTGNILLNNTSIPITNCVITNNTVKIPVQLEGTPGKVKDYTLTIPQGAFVEQVKPSNLCKEKIIQFQTQKTVSLPNGYTSQIDIQYSNADPAQNRMDVYYPIQANKPVPVVIHMHGGGWNHGEKESQTSYNPYFPMGFAVVNVEYRMTPHATAPAAVEDIRNAMMYLLTNATALNIDPNKIIFQGGSAGGHLALTAAYLDKISTYDTEYNYSGPFKIIAIIDKYGPADIVKFKEEYSSLASWLGNKKNDIEFVKSISPVHLITENTPPTYIVHGDADPTVPYEQSEILVDALQKAGVKYKFTTIPGGGHGGFSVAQNNQINDEINQFITEILNTNSSLDNINKEKIRPIVQGNTIIIPTEKTVQIFVYDVCGKKIQSSSKNSITLNNNGIFIVQAILEDITYNYKIRL